MDCIYCDHETTSQYTVAVYFSPETDEWSTFMAHDDNTARIGKASAVACCFIAAEEKVQEDLDSQYGK